MKGCKRCTDGDSCEQCGSGYVKVGDACEKCSDANSLECDSSDHRVSRKCKKGYTLNEDDKCKFASNVRGCAEGDASDANKCSKCKNNLALIS